MKKSTFIVLSLIANILWCQNNEDQNRIILQESKAISEVVTLYSYAVDGSKNVAGQKQSYSKFDKQGRVIHLIHYKAGNTGIDFQWFYTYNSLNKIIEATKKDASNNIIESYTVTYNKSQDPLIQKGSINGNQYQITYTYDNQLLISKSKTKDSHFSSSIEYFYNVKKQKTKEILINNGDTIVTKFEYNAKDLLNSKSTFIKNKPIETFFYEYNDQNLCIKENRFENNEEIITYKYEYNNHQKISSIIAYDHVLKYEKNTWKYTYDTNGLLVSIQTYDSGDKIPVYIKEYSFKFPKEEEKK